MAQLIIHHGRRGLFDDLLMSALNTALTLEAVVDVTVLVSHDLDLNVAGVGEVLFDQEVVASEGAEGL